MGHYLDSLWCILALTSRGWLDGVLVFAFIRFSFRLGQCGVLWEET